MVIDFHTHIFSPKIRENREEYADRDGCFAMLYSDPKAKMATAEELLDSMDESGIEMSVVLNYGWTTHELCVETNDYILESIAKYPKRLVGFASIQPSSPDPALAEIDRCAQAGIKGIGELRPDMQFFDPGDDLVMGPLVEAMSRYRLAFLVHASEPVGHSYPGKGSVTPAVLYPFIHAFPDLTVICAHWGGGLPFYALMPEVKAVLKNVYFDSAASPLLYRPEVYRQVIELVGAEKVLFGTDFPLLKPQRLIQEIKSLLLSAEVEAMVLDGNARRLLNIKNEVEAEQA